MTKTPSLAWTPECARLLEARDFEAQPPGTILRDIETLLAMTSERGLPLTPAHLFSMQTLETINQGLTHPVRLGLKRPVQKSYPPINGLYLVLRSTGLTLVDSSAKKPHLRADPDTLSSWTSLNGAERYFALLKAWWAHANEEIIGERIWGDPLSRCVDFVTSLTKIPHLVDADQIDDNNFRYRPGLHNLALLGLFGLLEIEVAPLADGQGWLPSQIRLTEWGRVLMAHYARFVHPSPTFGSREDMLDSLFASLRDPSERFEAWSLVLRPMIPGWSKALEIPAQPFRAGRHLFKVSLGAKCWRRIAIGGEVGLDVLASTILGAFQFDMDHLYRFSYKDRFGHTVEIDHPYLEGESDLVASMAQVGELPLSEGMRIGFLFDFGAGWELELVTERLDDGPPSQESEVVESHGKAPPQYGELEDW